MVREIGSCYSVVKYMEERIYIKVDDVDYAVQGEWVKITYKVTKRGDSIVNIRLATKQEIEEAKKIEGIIELDKIVTEEWNKAKNRFKIFKVKVKEKLDEIKDKIDK